MRGRRSSASEKTRGSLIAQANQRDARVFSAVRRRNRDSLHERYVHPYLALLPLKRAMAEVDKRFVAYLLELTDDVTGRIVDVLRRARSKVLPIDRRKWDLISSNTSVRECPPLLAKEPDFR